MSHLLKCAIETSQHVSRKNKACKMVYFIWMCQRYTQNINNYEKILVFIFSKLAIIIFNSSVIYFIMLIICLLNSLFTHFSSDVLRFSCMYFKIKNYDFGVPELETNLHGGLAAVRETERTNTKYVLTWIYRRLCMYIFVCLPTNYQDDEVV